MTIAAQTNRISITGNGVTTHIACNFPFTAQTDLVVVETVIATGVQTVKTLTTDYTITGTVDALGHYPNGGTVIMTVAPPSTVTITIYRDVPTTQAVDPVQNDRLPVDSAIEAPLDKLTMIAIRHRELINRSLHQPDGDTTAIAAIPPLVTRASRYLGFDGDGNPTMMQTPTGAVTTLVQLLESAYAALPAAGAAGTLYKVTDRSRGIWLDTGATWHPVNGGQYNVKDFGAFGNGVTDDTVAIQAAVDACGTLGGGVVWFPPGTYVVSDTVAVNYDFVTLAGAGMASKIVSHVIGEPTILCNAESLFNHVAHLWLLGNGLTGASGNGHGIAVYDPTPDTGAYAPQFCNVLSCRIASFKGVNDDGRGGSMLSAGIAFVSTLGCTVRDSYISSNNYGVYVDTSFTQRIHNCTTVDNVKYGIIALGITGTVEGLVIRDTDNVNNGDESTVAQTGWSTAPTGNIYLQNVVGSTIAGNKFKNGNFGNVMVHACQGLSFSGSWIRANNQYGVILRSSHGIEITGGMVDCAVGSTNTPTYILIQSIGAKDSHGISIRGVRFRFQGNQNIADCIRIEGDDVARRISGSIEDCYFGDVDLVGPCTISNIFNVSTISLSGFAIKRCAIYAETNATVGCILRTDSGVTFDKFRYEDVAPQENGGTISAEKIIPTSGFTEEFECEGSPEGVIAAYTGSRAYRKDGSTSTTLYVKTADNWDATGWTAK